MPTFCPSLLTLLAPPVPSGCLPNLSPILMAFAEPLPPRCCQGPSALTGSLQGSPLLLSASCGGGVGGAQPLPLRRDFPRQPAPPGPTMGLYPLCPPSRPMASNGVQAPSERVSRVKQPWAPAARGAEASGQHPQAPPRFSPGTSHLQDAVLVGRAGSEGSHGCGPAPGVSGQGAGPGASPVKPVEHTCRVRSCRSRGVRTVIALVLAETQQVPISDSARKTSARPLLKHWCLRAVCYWIPPPLPQLAGPQ